MNTAIHIDLSGTNDHWERNGIQYWGNKILNYFHRVDGPAILHPDGDETWWLDNQLHRLDGPAIISRGEPCHWFIYGQNLTESQFNHHPLVIEQRLNQALRELADEE